MGKINDIFRTHASAYLQAFGGKVPEYHRKVIDAIIGCRTGEFGYSLYQCPKCNHSHITQRSCGNRHCPECQGAKATRWLQKQLDKRLPCSYFMLTFTIPEELRDFVRANPKIAYSALFEAAAYAIKKLSKDKRLIGCDSTGFCAVLHTWGRQLQYHPHIHVIVPAGGIDRDGTRWLSSRDDFFLPVKALSKIFRGKFRELVQPLDFCSGIDPKQWRS